MLENKEPNNTELLRALPVQFVETRDGVILKRGCVEVKIAGEGAAEVVQIILDVTASGNITLDEICELFAAPERAAVTYLVQQLEARRILVSNGEADVTIAQPESNLEVFYWHFGETTDQVAKRFNAQRFVIIGVNNISRQLSLSLAASSIDNYEIVDYPILRNLRLFSDEGKLVANEWPETIKRPLSYEPWMSSSGPEALDCLIATSDHGGLQLMREWNQFCVKHERHFLPVVLQDLVGYIGPFVIPGETACFECFRARQNSHMIDPESQRACEYFACEGQKVAGFHPAMASIMGNIAAIELIKFYGIRMPLWRVGELLEVNLLSGRMETRKVLKLPRCSVCSTLNERSSIALTKNTFLPSQ